MWNLISLVDVCYSTFSIILFFWIIQLVLFIFKFCHHISSDYLSFCLLSYLFILIHLKFSSICHTWQHPMSCLPTITIILRHYSASVWKPSDLWLFPISPLSVLLYYLNYLLRFLGLWECGIYMKIDLLLSYWDSIYVNIIFGTLKHSTLINKK